MGMRSNTNQVGQGMGQTLTEEEKKNQQDQQQQAQQPQLPQTRAASMQSSAQQAPAVKALPKQQQAGTGTFANLKSYLQAAQGGGQQKIAQAATQKIQNVAGGAQKGIQQAQKTFGKQVQAGTIANLGTATKEAEDLIKAARGVTYQGEQPAPVQTPTVGSDFSEKVQTNPGDQYFKDLLGDKYQDFINDRRSMVRTISSMDIRWNPDTGTYGPSITKTFGEDELYAKYGIDKNKIPTQPQRVGGPALPPIGTYRSKTETETPTPTEPQAPAQPQQYFTPEQQKRFGEIINAQYAGPESLQQAGLYSDIAQKARTAQEAIKRTGSAAGREELLRDIFSQGRDYSRGQSKLDALLLNTSQQGISELQRQAQQAGNVQQQAEKAQTESANLAAERASQTSAAQQQARKAFLTGRTEEEALTETRIDKLIKEPVLDASGKPIAKLDAQGKPILDAAGQPVYQTQWDQLPEYFRNAIRNKETTNKAIQAEQLANLEKESGITEKDYKALTDKLKQKQDQLMRNQIQSMVGSSGTISPADVNANAGLKKEIEDLQAGISKYGDFPEQLKNIKNADMNALNLSQAEADVLGIKSGESIYNLGQDLIAQAQAERDRLITKDELSRQLALAQLAGVDTSRMLQKDLQYSDLSKAGSQTLASSLDTKAIRDSLNEAEKKFREKAAGETVTGKGVKKDKVTGKKYRVSESANLKEALKKLGYDFESELPSYEAPDLQKVAGSKEWDIDKNSIIDEITQNIKPTINPDKTFDPYTDSDSTLARKAGYAAADYGTLGISAGLRALGIDTAGTLMGGIDTALGTSIFGGGGDPAKNKRIAAEQARRNLVSNVQSTLKNQGFYNRAGIDDSQVAASRQQALLDLLKRQG